MLYEMKNELIKKYKPVLGEMGRRNPNYPDLGVAFEMLCTMHRTGNHTLYNGVPKDFDWMEFGGDLKRLAL